MTDEALPKGQTQEVKPEQPQEEQQEVQQISVEQILNGYPLDRDKCRDVIFLDASRNLGRIAQSLEAISQALVVVNTNLANLAKK